jgi:putative phosphoribosyl transferase
MDHKISNRTLAGRSLAEKLIKYEYRDDVIVLALPRGGVPVAYEIATALHAPLDVLVVRKLGIPNHEEYAMGAIAQGGTRILNEDAISFYNLSSQAIQQVEDRELQELHRREKVYRGTRPWPILKGRCVILVDDGLATGATMRAAIKAVKQHEAGKIVMAVPVASAQALDELEDYVDEAVCLMVPEPFYSVGQWYMEFNQTSDSEVLQLLELAHVH